MSWAPPERHRLTRFSRRLHPPPPPVRHLVMSLTRRTVLLSLGATSVQAGPSGQVVASFSILADMTRRVAGDLMRVTSLVPPDTDAHAWQPGAAESRLLSAAGVLVENGLGFEGWMARLGRSAGFRGEHIIATEGITPRQLGTGPDPHAWQNPRNGVRYVQTILRGLAAADPAHAPGYRANAAAFVAEIEALDTWIASQFAPVPPEARRIITTHDAFGYYGDRFGISFLAAEGLSTEAEPSAKAIAALVAQVKRERAGTVFLENMTDPRVATMLARETGAILAGPLFSDALSAPNGPAPNYLTMLRHNTNLFALAMRPA